LKPYRIAVIHDQGYMSWSVRELFRRIIELGHTPVYVRVSSMTYGTGAGGEYRLDGAIVRSLGPLPTAEEAAARLGFIRHLEASGVAVINPYPSLVLTRDKITQLIVLSEHGIPVPETIVTWSIGAALRKISEWGKAVLKPVIGSLGRGVILLEDADRAYYDLARVLRSGQPLYIQKYIEKPGRDLRIFTVGGEVLGGMYRVSTTSWKTNIAQGGTPIRAEPPEEAAELALKAARILGLEFAGVDIAEDKDGYKVIEVNSAPLWRGFKQATGIDPSVHIVKRLVELIDSKRG